MHVFFVEDGEMDKRVFLATWKDIPAQNEVQHTINNVQHNAGKSSSADKATNFKIFYVILENVHLYTHNVIIFFPLSLLRHGLPEIT